MEDKECCVYCEGELRPDGSHAPIKELPNEGQFQHIAQIVTTPIGRRMVFAELQCMDCLDGVTSYKIQYCPMCGRKLC